MIQLKSVSKSYAGRLVLDDVSWPVKPRDRVGLVGRNGSGKTTLLRLIAGIEEPDAGTIDIVRGTTIGYLPQEGARRAEGTVLDRLLSAFPEVSRLETELTRVHDLMSCATGDELVRLTRRAGELQHRFEAEGGYRIESEAKIILTGLGFSPDDHDRPLAEMSGGYRMRATLGSLLLRRPDYLLLDEPTNHLDLEAVTWLESFLTDSRSALIIVSHDRMFLNRLVTKIADLDRGRLTLYTGDYDRYRLEKKAARERQQAAAAQDAHRIAEVERFIERFRYKATKARQVQSRIKMLEKMKRTQPPPEEKTWKFLLPPAPRSAARAVSLENVSKSFDGKRVLGTAARGIDLELRRGDRLALVGPNGCGKTTLLKITAGLLAPDDGQVVLGEEVTVHYFAQHVLETLTPGRTVLEEMQAWAPGRTQRELRSLLGVFQYSGQEVFKKVDVLSGGEKNRLALARLMLDPGNLLLLDEPTNHLDLPAREALEDALARYDGTLLFISHDRYFINRVATKVAGLAGGALTIHDGDYDAFAAWMDRDATATSRRPARPASSRPGRRDKEKKRAEARARSERNQKLKSCRDRITAIEEAIVQVEHRIDEIDARLADPATYQDEGKAQELGRAKKSLQVDLSRLNRQWEEAHATLQELEAKPRSPVKS
ncbi:MAG: ABC-F family ATP-binding cassette domain-containing protein [Acidobacteriota bacterium]